LIHKNSSQIKISADFMTEKFLLQGNYLRQRKLGRIGKLSPTAFVSNFYFFNLHFFAG